MLPELHTMWADSRPETMAALKTLNDSIKKEFAAFDQQDSSVIRAKRYLKDADKLIRNVRSIDKLVAFSTESFTDIASELSGMVEDHELKEGDIQGVVDIEFEGDVNQLVIALVLEYCYHRAYSEITELVE